MLFLIYTVVIVAATSLGAMAGLGGGVIIKPLLDLVGAHNATAVGLYSSIAVFTMCCISLAKQIRAGFDFDRTKILAVSAGALAGGLLGERIFSAATVSLENRLVKAVQAGILAIILLGILIYTVQQDRMPSWRIESPAAMVLVGVVLGAASVFLGIGGGPINVAVFTMLFSLEMKQAAVYSLATIFFSQGAKLATNAVNGGLFALDLAYLPFVVLPAIAGGVIGTALNRRCSEATIRRTFVCVVASLVLLSAYNCWRGLAA